MRLPWSRWRIETEFETKKSDMGLDEYETRSWAGWHHHVALCLLGGAFLLSLQQAWGEKMPRITRPQVYRVVREMLPRERLGPDELMRWLEQTQECNERARRSHAKRRAALRASPNIPSLNRRCNIRVLPIERGRVDGHHLSLGQLGHRLHPVHETGAELVWVQPAEHPPKGVGGWNTVGQP